MLLVSLEDAEWIKTLAWLGKCGRRGVWYCREQGSQKKQILSRSIVALRMDLDISGLQVDHINRNIDDNRRENLRLATHGQNRSNSVSHNKTGFKGVKFKSPAKIQGRKRRSDYRPSWDAHITIDNKVHFLGNFTSPEEAHTAYMKAAKLAKGEFANDGK